MNLLDNIHIILVEPLYAGNMGSAARAMKNMGIHNLSLVSPREDHLSLEAVKMSVSAYDILQRAKVYDSLDEAVGDYSYLAATTTRKRKGFPYRSTARGIAPGILKRAASGKTGIMFGREDKGLFNDEVALADEIVTIPASSGLTSLNLAQAVLLMCYEIFQCHNPDDVPPLPSYKTADVRSKGDYIRHLESSLRKIGFFHSSSQNHVMYSVKDLLDRAAPSERDIRILRGMLRQFDWYLDADEGK